MWVFYGIMIGVFIWGIVDIILKKNAKLQAGLSVGFGMLGTFVGVYLGLNGFNVNDITASVPVLLDGMKTAFLTSIVGMVFNILLKSFSHIHSLKDDQTKGKSEAEAVISLLSDIVKNGQENSTLMKNIEKSISGDGDSTLLTNIQKLRTNMHDNLTDLRKDVKDNLSELNNSFKDFAQKQADNNTKALIEALNDVMRDFSTKINDQLGENFKEFNNALAKILEWQENYKEYVEKMTERFSLALEGIDTCRSMADNIIESQKVFANSQKVFNEAAEDLVDLLDNLNTDLDGMRGIADKATDAFPLIHNNIEKLTKYFTSQVENSMKQIDGMLQGQITKMSTQQTIFDNAYKKFEQDHITIAENATKRITDHMVKIDAELEKELTEALNQFGSYMTQISKQFANDYQKLADFITKVEATFNRSR